MCIAETRTFEFVVKGPFTFEDYIAWASSLEEVADVKDSFFSRIGQKMPAAATFLFSTDENESRVREIFTKTVGVEVVDLSEERESKNGNTGE